MFGRAPKKRRRLQGVGILGVAVFTACIVSSETIEERKFYLLVVFSSKSYGIIGMGRCTIHVLVRTVPTPQIRVCWLQCNASVRNLYACVLLRPRKTTRYFLGRDRSCRGAYRVRYGLLAKYVLSRDHTCFSWARCWVGNLNTPPEGQPRRACCMSPCGRSSVAVDRRGGTGVFWILNMNCTAVLLITSFFSDLARVAVARDAFVLCGTVRRCGLLSLSTIVVA